MTCPTNTTSDVCLACRAADLMWCPFAIADAPLAIRLPLVATEPPVVVYYPPRGVPLRRPGTEKP